MRFAVFLIDVNPRQDLNEFFFCVPNISEQFIVEMQYLGAMPVCCAPIIHVDVTVQLRLDIRQSLRYFSIDGPADCPRYPRPRIDFDGSDLYQSH